MTVRRLPILLFLIALAVAPAAPAATPAPRDPVDLTGVWWGVNVGSDFKPDPALTPSAQVVWNEVRAAMAAGKTVHDSAGSCVPPGTPRLMTRVYPIQWIRYAKGYVLIHEFENAVRWIYLDGRKAPVGDDLIPTYNGYSVGRWEGETLVVETTGFKPKSDTGMQVWVQMGVPVTPQLKLVEKYRLAEGGKALEVELTMTDPSILTRPWVSSRRADLRPEVEIMEFTCLAEENPIVFQEDGTAVFRDFAPPAAK